MQPKPAEDDPFDLGFDADDEFATPQAADENWRGSALLDDDGPSTPHPDPFVGLPRDPEPVESADRFAALPITPMAAAAPPPASAFEEARVDPFADLPRLPEATPDPKVSYADCPKSTPSRSAEW